MMLTMGLAPLLIVLLPKASMVVYAIGEELVKFAVLKSLGKELSVRLIIFGGFIFGVSETMLYLPYSLVIGQYDRVLLRACLTIPMHMTSCWVMMRGKYGLILALAIHLLFNYLVLKFLGINYPVATN